MEHIGDNVISFLKNATQKLENLQVQTALGKAELSDKLEEIKLETKDKINHLKWDANSVLEDGKENLNHLKAKMEHLNLQLALARAETAEEFDHQKKNISNAIKDVKKILAKD
jgi:exonuclease VII large subunit